MQPTVVLSKPYCINFCTAFQYWCRYTWGKFHVTSPCCLVDRVFSFLLVFCRTITILINYIYFLTYDLLNRPFVLILSYLAEIGLIILRFDIFPVFKGIIQIMQISRDAFHKVSKSIEHCSESLKNAPSLFNGLILYLFWPFYIPYHSTWATAILWKLLVDTLAASFFISLQKVKLVVRKASSL